MSSGATDHQEPAQLVRHARTVASLTLVSRVFGLVRDALLARALGLTGIGTSFSIAFQIPNTFRRLFGEGALSAAFIPEYAQQTKRDPALADRLASLVLALLIVATGAVTIVAEIAGALLLANDSARAVAGPIITLTMIMLPFMPLVCATALLGGMLQVHGRFAPQAGAPIILNLCMIVAVGSTSLIAGAEPMTTALVVAVSVVIAGALQVAWCALALRGHVRWTRAFSGTRSAASRIVRRMIPVIIGLGALQISTLLDSLIAGYPVMFGPELPGGAAYPMDEGAGATLGFTQRLYQFPLGVFGIALATASLPLLSRLADDGPAFTATLRRAIRLALLIGLPASVGLAIVAHDATAVVYLGRAVDEPDTRRMAGVLLMYAPLIATFSLVHVLNRAFYAQGRTATPTRIGLVSIALGLVLNLTLMWPLAERGLALASSIAAVFQLAMLGLALQRDPTLRYRRVLDRETGASIMRIVGMTSAMALILLGLRLLWPRQVEPGYSAHALRLAVDIAIGAGTYGILMLAMARQELRWLLERRDRGDGR